jgi:hypothetical protein
MWASSGGRVGGYLHFFFFFLPLVVLGLNSGFHLCYVGSLFTIWAMPQPCLQLCLSFPSSVPDMKQVLRFVTKWFNYEPYRNLPISQILYSATIKNNILGYLRETTPELSTEYESNVFIWAARDWTHVLEHTRQASATKYLFSPQNCFGGK